MEYGSEVGFIKNRTDKGNERLQKIISILLLGVFSVSCSVIRNSGNKTSKITSNILSANVLESVQSQNITNCSFLISKAEIEVLNQNGKERFIGIIKFEYPNKYLVSIKSRSGIEGIRIYISEDSILVNDRMNKKVYIGTSFYLERKYGLTNSLLPLIIGDIVLDKNREADIEVCSGDKLRMECPAGGILLNYEIDCNKRKAILVNQVTDLNEHSIKIKYGSFFNIGGVLTPKLIELKDSKSETTIKIRIVKIERPWYGKVQFVPGRGYKLMELL